MKGKPIRTLKVITTLFLSGLFVLPVASFAKDQGLESLRQSGQAFREVAKKVSPGVVFIQVEKSGDSADTQEFGNPFGGPFGGDEFFRRFFGQPPQGRQPRNMPKPRAMGQGSGFIISSDGLIMTNNHVAGDADKITVRLLDGREFQAKTVGSDPATDVAIIKIEAKGLPALELGNSDQLEVGDWVLAVGNPFGLTHTLTAGIVSAKGRSGMGINDYENFIQTDAAINPGNSGGPLVNLDGQVVGMNTAIFSRSGGYMGIGFAIPINMAKEVREQLLTTGKVVRGHLGVYIQDLTDDLARSFNLDKAEGILISQVMTDSPAAKAGLQQGDIILKADGRAVDKVNEFRNGIAMKTPGSVINLDILRDGKPRQVKVTIGKQEGTESGQSPAEAKVGNLGLKLQALTPELAGELGYQGEKGVIVAAVEPNSAADRAGIERGDLIQEINRKPSTTTEEARQLLKSAAGKSVVLLVRHGEASRYVILKGE